VVENPPFCGADPGNSWAITFSGGSPGIWPVYNPAVIPPELTGGRKISFPDVISSTAVEKQGRQ